MVNLCKVCDIQQEDNNFPVDKRTNKDGTISIHIRNTCYTCKAKIEAERRKKIQAEKKITRELNNKESLINPKTCNTCKVIKNASEFVVKSDKKKDGTIHQRLNFCCKECDNAKSRARHVINKEKYNETKKLYRQTSEKDKERRKNSIVGKLRSNYINRIKAYLKKDKHTEEYLGTDFQTVIKWLEFNFQDDFNWKNYGHELWNLDHTMCLNDFDFTNNLENDEPLAFSWMNLMPMLSVRNASKGAKFCPKLIMFQEMKVREFAKKEEIDHLEIDNYFKKYSEKFKDLIATRLVVREPL